jgi:molybdate transport repressor ModE-like protein
LDVLEKKKERKMEVKVKVWIEDDKNNLVFGGGKTEILEYIKETGSIAEASQKIGLSYKKTWSHIQILEKYIEDSLVITQKGGGEQGGTTLTPKAIEIIENFKLLQNEVKEYTKQRFTELFENSKTDILNLKN